MSGGTLVFTSLRGELQKAILGKQVARSDSLARGGAPPRLLGAIAELEPFFDKRASMPPAADVEPATNRRSHRCMKPASSAHDAEPIRQGRASTHCDPGRAVVAPPAIPRDGAADVRRELARLYVAARVERSSGATDDRGAVSAAPTQSNARALGDDSCVHAATKATTSPTSVPRNDADAARCPAGAEPWRRSSASPLPPPTAPQRAQQDSFYPAAPIDPRRDLPPPRRRMVGSSRSCFSAV